MSVIFLWSFVIYYTVRFSMLKFYCLLTINYKLLFNSGYVFVNSVLGFYLEVTVIIIIMCLILCSKLFNPAQPYPDIILFLCILILFLYVLLFIAGVFIFAKGILLVLFLRVFFPFFQRYYYLFSWCLFFVHLSHVLSTHEDDRQSETHQLVMDNLMLHDQ